ncbi:MAG: glycosyltransferase family 2 protein, partial [Butyrivibrio sp.]|nr:glycosyltransferase family 2 protein [Butyrivibrio sp.]
NCEYLFIMKVTPSFKKACIKIKFNGVYSGVEAGYTVDGRSFRKQQANISGSIDEVKYNGDTVSITGWCADALPIDISLEGAKDCNVRRVFRSDVADYYQEDGLKEAAGFVIELPKESCPKKADVLMRTGARTTVKTVWLDKEVRHKHYGMWRKIALGFEYCRQHGASEAFSRVRGRLAGNSSAQKYKTTEYSRWIKKHDASKSELDRQRKVCFEKKPVFSIVVPVYRPNKGFFTEMLESVKVQTYPNWELCLADGGGEGFLTEECVRKVFGDDERVKYQALSENTGISGNTNRALALAEGDYIALLDHDDLLRPDALYECARVVNEFEAVDVIYTDEDKLDSETGERLVPHFKPDFNPYLLRSCNYITHFFVFSKELSWRVGDFNSECDGAQDYDMILRCTEKARNIKHIPKILYTWRCHENSTANNTDAKSYAYTAGVKALEGHYKRLGIKASVSRSKLFGYYDTRYALEEEPLVSVIIPNKDHTDDLDKCLRSIIGRQSYGNYEIIIVENNSTDGATFEYYKRLESENDCVRVLYYEGDFNFSRINNFAVRQTKGDYLLFLNNDTEMLGTDCLRELVGVGVQPEVGAVGARLLYSDDVVQHAGVIIGLSGVAGHAFAGEAGDNSGYFARAVITQNYSAVTAACMLVRRSVFDEVGGFEEALKVSYNDVDFCLKIREKGWLIVYNPAAELYHYESKSRGMEDTPEKLERFNKEIDFMLKKWKKIYDEGDPSYNPNLSLKIADFSLRE